jgi:hypothetical protein
MKTGWVIRAELKAYIENEREVAFSKNSWMLNGLMGSASL